MIWEHLAPDLEPLRAALVAVEDGKRGSGAGVLIGPGRVLTNAHVVGNSRRLLVRTSDEELVEAQPAAVDPVVDLALLAIPLSRDTWAQLASRQPRPGELVFARGHPWGQRGVLTGGILSARVTLRTPAGEVQLLRTDLRLAPGSSGGPLLNAAGEILGLNALILGGDQSLAIPADRIRAFLAASQAAEEVWL